MKTHIAPTGILLIFFFLSECHATGQIPDVLQLENNDYSIVGIKGELLTPSSFGLKTKPSSSANWRGFYVSYAIKDDKLLASEITINTYDGNYPIINGVNPDKTKIEECKKNKDAGCFSNGAVYRKLNLFVDFTGKIRIARKFLNEFYVHMGYQKPSAYEVVYDLEIAKGVLINLIDRSKEAKEIRGRFSEKYQNSPSHYAVEEAFSLDITDLK